MHVDIAPGTGAITLTCSGPTFTLTTLVTRQPSPDGTQLFDTITYTVTGGATFTCPAQPEDGVSPCVQTYPAGTEVTVAFSDNEQFGYTCSDLDSGNDTSAPFDASCLPLLMTEDRTVTIQANLQL